MEKKSTRRRERGRRGRGGGDLDHDAELGRADAGLGGRLGERGADPGHLVQRARPSAPGRPSRVSRPAAQDRAELVASAPGREQGGQAVLWPAEERRDLVAGEVEQPDDRWPAREQAEDRRQLGQVLGLGRPARGAGEGDLGAQQADAGRAAGQAQPGLGGRGDVAQQRDRLAVGRPVDLLAGPRTVRVARGPEGWRRSSSVRGRVDDQLARGGVEDRVVPGRRGQHRRVGADQHGQAETAGDDRRVRAGPARRPTPRPGQAPACRPAG